MYVILKAVYPHHLKKKVVERYLKLTKDNPPNPAVKVFSTYTECGKMVAIQITEVAPENLGQTMAETMKFLLNYDDIEGYEYEIRASFSIGEALKLVE